MQGPASAGPEADLSAALVQHLLAWAGDNADAGQQSAISRAGSRLSAAIAAGHVCLQLEPADEALASALLASGLAERAAAERPGRALCPLVVDAEGRLYLRRHHRFEVRLARALAARRASTLPDPAPLAAFLTAQGSPAEAPDWQLIAVALAAAQPLAIVSGGPGTGKTTTIATLLAAVLQGRSQLRIALAAPTGKAAARMLEALRARAGARFPELLERLPGEAHTVHRLLGVRGDGSFSHDATHPLALDVLVVDEASMLDLALATRLVEAVPPTARLILLGDKDQLAAVEAGAVFAELSAGLSYSPAFAAWLAEASAQDAAILPTASTPAPLQDQVVWFTRSHRFGADSGIGRLAAAIRAGEGDAALVLLEGDAPDLAWIDDPGINPGEAVRKALLEGYAPYFGALRDAYGPSATAAPAPAALFAAFDAFRALCAVREGGWGTRAINTWLAQALRTHLPHPANAAPHQPWFVGRPVMVLRNDYALGLYNGDIGLCLPDATGQLQVLFPGAQGYRAFSPLRLPEVDSAFAHTVHKSQGSEFAHICLLLPEQDSPVMTRELLYTGLTRAARHALIAGRPEVFRGACARPTRRSSGLLDRLAEALDAAR